jgi:hypothetical protein
MNKWIVALVCTALGLYVSYSNRRMGWHLSINEFMVGEITKAGFSAILLYFLAHWIWLRGKK